MTKIAQTGLWWASFNRTWLKLELTSNVLDSHSSYLLTVLQTHEVDYDLNVMLLRFLSLSSSQFSVTETSLSRDWNFQSSQLNPVLYVSVVGSFWIPSLIVNLIVNFNFVDELMDPSVCIVGHYHFLALLNLRIYVEQKQDKCWKVPPYCPISSSDDIPFILAMAPTPWRIKIDVCWLQICHSSTWNSCYRSPLYNKLEVKIGCLDLHRYW